jgi:hypothetical protein
MNRRRLVNAAIRTACAYMWASGAATVWAADAATHWNDVATTAINAAGRFPAGITDLAKVHLAIHDAVQAFEHTAEPYCADIANASGVPEAAVARAARDVLVAQLPAAQDATVEAAYQDYLAANGLGGNAGLAVGQQAAACILGLRRRFSAAHSLASGGRQPRRPSPWCSRGWPASDHSR